MKLLTGTAAILSAWLFLLVGVEIYCKTYIKPVVAIRMGSER